MEGDNVIQLTNRMHQTKPNMVIIQVHEVIY